MTNILITGGAGFIGGHIAEYFCQLPDSRVTVLDNFRSGHRRNLEAPLASGRLRLVEGSICDAPLVLQAAEGADYIFHLAAMISVPESVERPQECVELNVNGTLNVLEAARRHRVKKVVLSSSAAIYGDDPTLPKSELMRPAPKSPYGVTKLDGEYYLEMFREQWGVPTASLRYFNVFGPRQDPRSQYAAAVPIFVHRALQGEPITIFGDGGATRDFVFVKDIVAANVLAATTPEMNGVFNVARGESTSVADLARTIVEVTGSRSEILFAPERPGDIRHSLADTSKIRKFGFAPKVTLSEGLKAILATASV